MHTRSDNDKAIYRKTITDRIFWSVIAVGAVIASLIMVLIVIFLVVESYDFIDRVGVLHFVTDDGWWPLDQLYNLTPMLVASLGVSFGALAIASPLAIIFSVYCVFYNKGWWQGFFERIVDVTAAIPTVIYGFWGLMVVVPIMNKFTSHGVNLFSGMLVLAMMIFPTIAMLTTSALKSVPFNQIQGATALGVRRSSLIKKIALPHAKPGIVMAMILGITRAIGETMVVLMLCGNVVQFPSSLFDPTRTLTANIALEMPYAMGDHRSSLFVTGLMVLIVVSILVIISEVYANRKRTMKH